MTHRIDEQITFRKLEALLAFMEAGSLARAGECLGSSAVSVHRALRSLEEAMRCALFRHEGRSLVPLEAAHVLADAAREVLHAMRMGVQATREAGGYSSEQMRIGSLYSLTIRLVPRLVLALKVRKPLLHTELVFSSNEKLVEKLRSGSIDAAFIVLPLQAADIESYPMLEDELLFAAPPGWTRCRGDEVDLLDCIEERFVSLGDDFATDRGMREAFAVAGYQPRIAMRTDDIFSLMSLVSGGIGCALLPSRAKDAFVGQVQWLRLAPPYRVKQQVGMVFLKARERDPNILALLSTCRTMDHRAKAG